MTTSESNPERSQLIHVHTCISCGSTFRREEVEGRVHTTGLFVCPNCEVEGPLNIEIRQMGSSESKASDKG